jgi:hypothetical protein
MRIMVMNIFGNMRGHYYPRLRCGECLALLIKSELVMYCPRISSYRHRTTTSYVQHLSQYQHQPLGHLVDHLSVLVSMGFFFFSLRYCCSFEGNLNAYRESRISPRIQEGDGPLPLL